MSIAQTECRVMGTFVDIPITCLTVDELEALLEACAYSLRQGQTLYNSLVDCGTDSKFDSETMGELEYQHQSRSELTGLASAVASRLHELNTDDDEMPGDFWDPAKAFDEISESPESSIRGLMIEAFGGAAE